MSDEEQHDNDPFVTGLAAGVIGTKIAHSVTEPARAMGEGIGNAVGPVVANHYLRNPRGMAYDSWISATVGLIGSGILMNALNGDMTFAEALFEYGLAASVIGGVAFLPIMGIGCLIRNSSSAPAQRNSKGETAAQVLWGIAVHAAIACFSMFSLQSKIVGWKTPQVPTVTTPCISDPVPQGATLGFKSINSPQLRNYISTYIKSGRAYSAVINRNMLAQEENAYIRALNGKTMSWDTDIIRHQSTNLKVITNATDDGKITIATILGTKAGVLEYPQSPKNSDEYIIGNAITYTSPQQALDALSKKPAHTVFYQAACEAAKRLKPGNCMDIPANNPKRLLGILANLEEPVRSPETTDEISFIKQRYAGKLKSAAPKP